MADVNITYKGASIATMDASGTKTLETSGKYCEDDIAVVYTDPEKPTQTKSVTPSESAQTVTPDSGKVLSQVNVGAISSTYVGTGVTRKAAQTYTPGTADQTIPAARYLTGAQTIKGDANLVAGNIKSGVSIFGVAGTHTGGITPSGTKRITITQNGTTTEDVTNYASAAITVNVPSQSINAYVADVTVATHTASNVALCTLPDDVYAHKDDDTFTVSLVNLTPASLTNYDDFMVIACNNPNFPKNSSGFVFYGTGMRKMSSGASKLDVWYPPNSTNNSTSYGGIGKFWLNGKVLTYKCNEYWLGAGTIRVTVTW